MYIRTFLTVVLMLATSTLTLAQIDFNKFIQGIEEDGNIKSDGARRYLKVTAIEEQDNLSSLELDTLKKFDGFYGLSFFLTDQNKCELGFFVTLDESGFIIDQVQHTSICEIDLDATSFASSEGELIDGYIKILQEEESVVYISDSTDNLDNSETELLIYNKYYYIESDGFFTELSSPKKVSLDREYAFASQDLLKPEDLEDYSKNELRVIRNEILASYGHIFDDEIMQTKFEETSWYSPKGDATELLTDLENRNLELIDSLILN